VALSLGGALFTMLALRTGRTEVMRGLGTAGSAAFRFIPLLFGLGGILGLLAAIVAGYNLLAPWLVIAYVLFVGLSVSGGALSGPTAQRIGKIVGPAPDGPLPTEALPLVQRFYRVEAFEISLLVLIVFDMVVKPFS